MKLSEAIREGATKRPQAFWDFACVNEQGSFGTCALGAALESALGIKPSTDPGKFATTAQFDQLNELTGGALFMFAENPVTGKQDHVNGIIMVLNDEGYWEREEIAEWLEGLGL